jgi:glycosyltransferase involved in cell wall biosynthesis
MGQYASINEAIKLATGDFLVIISADDFFFDDQVFYKISAALVSNKKINLIYGKSLRVSEKGHPIASHEIIIKEPFAKWRFKYQFPLLHCSTFVRSSFLLNNNLYFDDLNFKYAADWDWFLRMSRLTDFFFIDLIVSKYRVHEAQTTNRVKRKILNMEDIRVLRKNKSSILIYYLLKNLERLHKAYIILQKQGVRALCKKIIVFIKL